MLHNLTGWHALILLAVVLLFFGASKLPALAKSVGQSARILKSESRDGSSAADAPATSATTVDAPVPADRL
ncbi:twin-arginine translocase TatA/TatE family subunit [Agreia sp. PsM10]|uniref:twin-arginine translocase TatA/TatE family subunit n=1 Tax=Agreia sp. PsM10 TaxID=3030533 RepID=UPI00263AAD3F|nr:twin-arginine translocase TatA/TatE family subunit [Agreia sp. PsM10]MDN4641066.1 twin-arginine translocase TatA/TatE family subunit [Agreia sp. PsM10]